MPWLAAFLAGKEKLKAIALKSSVLELGSALKILSEEGPKGNELRGEIL